MITFPSNPTDGETVVDKVDDYVVIVWTYNEDANEWTSQRYGPVESYVFTDQVLVRDNVQELPDAADTDPSELLTQKDVNHYLNDNAGGGTDEELAARVEGLEADQGRQDNDLADYKSEVSIDQQRQDKALDDYKHEVLVDQQRQDKALADYKVLVAEEQAEQNKALQNEADARAGADAAHDAQLNTLEYKLDALVGLQFKGVYTFKHDADCDAAYLACLEAAGGDPTAQSQCNKDQVACSSGKAVSGTFEAVDPDDRFDHLLAIVIHKNSKDGQELEWDSILKAGDYLEIDHKADDSLDKQNYGLYRLKVDPVESTNGAGEPVYDLELEFLQGSGDLVEGQDYEIRGITADQGINPEELGDFLLKEEAANTYALKSHSHSDYITKEADNSSYKDWLLKADGGKRNPADFAGSQHAHGWTEITGKPATYAPASHTHDYAAKTHSHTNYASTSHTHSGYASSSHNHDTKYVKGNYTITVSNGNYYIS